jgi:hypothetical protein
VTTRYLYLNGEILQTYSDSGLNQTFIYGNDIDDPLVMIRGDQRYYYLKDRQNSIQALSDEEAKVVEHYRYSAFGQTRIYQEGVI